jgi:hypothetical protein
VGERLRGAIGTQDLQHTGAAQIGTSRQLAEQADKLGEHAHQLIVEPLPCSGAGLDQITSRARHLAPRLDVLARQRTGARQPCEQATRKRQRSSAAAQQRDPSSRAVPDWPPTRRFGAD